MNVLVNSEFRAVITDFDSARRLREAAHFKEIDNNTKPALMLEATVCSSTNTITLTGNKYTLRWAAPELLNDEEPHLASDIWALGWIFYEVNPRLYAHCSANDGRNAEGRCRTSLRW